MIKPIQQWIGAEAGGSAPLFRHEFACERPLAEAVLCISGVGYHEAWLNGLRVGDHVLDPSQTDYERRVFFVRHDVTALLRNGANVLGVVLGNGWYNQDMVWGKNGLANLHGFPEDCPAREKCGWLGDANLVAEYALWNCV